MKEMDCVEVVVEKGKYTREGVHKGMQGWICDPRCVGGYWLVNFPGYGVCEDIGTIAVKEADLQVIQTMDATVNGESKK